MSRLVEKSETGPLKISVGGEDKWICMCGLSANQPFCNGSHKQTHGEEPGKVYSYENGVRNEVTV